MMKRRSMMAGIVGAAATWTLPAHAADEDFGGKDLIAAADKEGALTYYTANFAEVEQEVIKAFNKRFPKIKISMVRAPGGQLITRIKTEAAANTQMSALAKRGLRSLRIGRRETTLVRTWYQVRNPGADTLAALDNLRRQYPTQELNDCP